MKELIFESGGHIYPEALESWNALSKRAHIDAPYQSNSFTTEAIQEALEPLFSLVSADKKKDRFVFTSGVEESCSQVFATFFSNFSNPKKNHFIGLETDIAPIYLALLAAQEKQKIELSLLKPQAEGTISCDEIADVITEKTALISLSAASPLIGVVHNLSRIAQLAHQHNAFLHIDIGTTLSTLPFSLEEIDADYISFDGQDIGSIRGTGALFIRNGAPISPLIFGHKCHERYRGGPINIPSLAAFGVAAKKTKQDLIQASLEISRLKSLFERDLKKRVPQIQIVCEKEKRVPSLSTIIFPKVKNELLLFALLQNKVFASIGGARYQNIDSILHLAGMPWALSMCAIAFSFSRDLSGEDVDEAIERIVGTYTTLARLT